MKRWVVPVFVTLVAISSAWPAKSKERVKRADETVMFGNQQNQAHKSVKKSGPPPLDSKLAEKQAKVAASHAASEDDPVRELADMMNSAPAASTKDSQPEKDLHTLVSHGDSEANAPLIEEASKQPTEGSEDRKKKEDKNMGEKPKREEPVHEEPSQQDIGDAQYLYLLNKYGPGAFMLDKEDFAARRRKRDVTSKLSGSRLNRIRRDLSKMASESHMSAATQHRKKREIDVDPDQLAAWEYLLSRSNDGYETPEEVIDPTYVEDEIPAEYEPEPERERRDLLDDYARYAVAKRVPDEEVEEGEQEEVDPVSVYESEYGPVTYGLIEHEGVPGLFVPLQQESMRRLLAAEEQERDDERSRLRTLSTILSLNQQKRK